MVLIEVHQNDMPKWDIKSFLSGMLQQSHRTLFVYIDLQPRNNIIKDGNVVAIIDRDRARWYPEYWDFAEALLI